LTYLIESQDVLQIRNEIEWGFACADDSAEGEYRIESKDGKLSFVFLRDGRLMIYTKPGYCYYFLRGKSATPYAIWYSSPEIRESWGKEFPKFAAAMRRHEAACELALLEKKSYH
jgi:hypothetical protein